MAATPLSNYTHITTDATPTSSQELYPQLMVLRERPCLTDQEVALGTKTDQAVIFGDIAIEQYPSLPSRTSHQLTSPLLRRDTTSRGYKGQSDP
eukprot:3270224-Rhodomonas_salina.1